MTNKLIKLSILALTPVLLSGCLGGAVSLAGNVVEGAINITGDVAEGAVDQVTTSKEEKMEKDWEKSRKEKKRAK
ncbi:MAG: hypothetical protein CME88_17165 [Hirschia sp.]|nr:hypothetical protein [Hirschia sp.]|tara:strand:- start:127 stop:351 length:225 start_codon:yes stop_codon:yes gene_type:complete